jgi:hypothetical protein
MERPTSTLDALVARLQQRYGSRAAQRGAAVPPPAAPQALATGHAALDAALPHRGLPRGRLTTIHGPRSAGATTLALTTIAQAQAAGDPACLLDLTQTFAPVAAAACGVRLADLAVARPVDGDAAALVVATLLARRAVGALVIDSLPAWLALPRGPAALAALLPRLPRLLAASGCALIVLHPFPTGLLPDATAPLHTIPAPLTALRLRRSFAQPVADRTVLTRVLTQLVERLAATLAQRGMQARSLALHLAGGEAGLERFGGGERGEGADHVLVAHGGDMGDEERAGFGFARRTEDRRLMAATLGEVDLPLCAAPGEAIDIRYGKGFADHRSETVPHPPNRTHANPPTKSAVGMSATQAGRASWIRRVTRRV